MKITKIIFCLVALSLLSMRAFGAAYVVNTTADSSDASPGDGTCATALSACSLRAAIEEANIATSNDSITFGITATITLLSDLPNIVSGKGTLTMSGPVTINGAGSFGLTVKNGASLTMSQIVFESGDQILNNGTLSLSEVTLRSFTSTAHGAIYNDAGTLTMDKSTITLSKTGIYNSSGTATLNHTSLTSNTGWGFFNYGVAGSSTTPLGTATIQNSTISGNGMSTGSSSTGGIFNTVRSVMTLVNSTVSGNMSPFQGAGIANASDLNIYNSTITGNLSYDLTGDFAAGIQSSDIIVELSHTLIAGNFVLGVQADCSGVFSSHGYNLVGFAPSYCNITPTDGTDQIGRTSTTTVDPLLGVLQYNGGFTLTHELLTGSPAIDAGDVVCSYGVTTDQRDMPRPINGKCDIGAYESAVTTYTYYDDDDGDGYGDPTDTIVDETPPDGYVDDSTDCVDTNAAIHPDAAELCNGVDDDCDSVIDEDCSTYYPDADGDLYGDEDATGEVYVTPPAGYVADHTDCNDLNGRINPAATEICNGIDDNCNGLIDDFAGFKLECYKDGDDDTFGDPDTLLSIVACRCPDDYIRRAGDCNDADAAYHPGAAEVCDDPDYNCDEATLDCALPDNDGDGYTPDTGDCDDTNATVHPGASEICDGLDNDCDGVIDEDPTDGTIYYADTDGDGFGNANSSLNACPSDPPENYTQLSGDCDDTNATINPNAAEICGNSVDEDCSGADQVCCGNLAINNGETCDDGNATTGDGCDSSCQIEVAVVVSPVSSGVLVDPTSDTTGSIQTTNDSGMMTGGSNCSCNLTATGPGAASNAVLGMILFVSSAWLGVRRKTKKS